jgi:hypothetical protein
MTSGQTGSGSKLNGHLPSEELLAISQPVPFLPLEQVASE